MLPSLGLRCILWFVCLTSILANLGVIVNQIKSKIPAMRDLQFSEVKKKQNTFLLNLAIANFLMGVYLLSIGIVDAKFADAYFLYAHGWRSGVGCKIIGLIALVSNVASILSVTFVSVESFFSIAFCHFRCPFGSKIIILKYVLLWIISGVMALTQVVLSVVVQESSEFSDICVRLPFVTVPETTDYDVWYDYGYDAGTLESSTDSPHLQWVYSQIVYIHFSSACVFIITLCYVAMLISILASEMRSGRHRNNSEKLKAVIMLFIIVSTDLICWLPVIIIGILSKHGLRISIGMYTWLATFVMTVNSAFNPFVYIISTRITRRNNEPSFIGE